MADGGSVGPAAGPERFLELLQASEGPMKRLYLARLVFTNPRARPKLLSDKTFDKTIAKLSSKFPDLDADKNQDKGLEAILSKAKTYMDEFEPHYLAFLEAFDWKIRALAFLTDVGSKVTGFKLDENPMLTAYWFELLVRFVQLHVLMSLVPDRKQTAVLYARLYQHTKCLPEPNFVRLARWMADYEEPFTKLQEEFKNCGTIITNAILELRTTLTASASVADLRKGEALNITLKPAQMAVPVHDQLRHDVGICGRARIWMTYALLCCPQSASTARVVDDLVRPLLSDSVVLPVYNELSVHPHSELAELWNNFRDKKAKLDRFKKIPKECLLTASSSGPALHRARRVYVRQELEQLLHVSRDTPALLGPKILVYLSAMSYAKSELLLYYRHRVSNPDTSLAKHFRPSDWADSRVPELVGVLRAVSDHIRAHRASIAQYYAEFLAGADAAAARSAVEQIRSAGGNASAAQRVAEALSSAGAAAIVGGSVDLDAVRSACLEMEYAHSNAALARPGLTEPGRVFRIIMEHTRYVDMMEELLEENASLSELWYVHDCVREDFEAYARSSGDIVSAPIWVASFLRLLADFPKVALEFWAEERELIGADCVRLASEYLDRLMALLRDNISTCISLAVSNELQLRDRNGADVLARKRDDWKPPKDYVPPVVPGTESLYSSRHAIDSIRIATRNSSAILKSLSELGPIVVYDSQISPIEWVRETLQVYLQDWLRNAFRVTNDIMERPSDIQRQLNAVLSVISTCEHNMTMHLEAILRETVVNEFWIREVGTFGSLDTFPLVEVNYDSRAIGNVVAFYSSVVSKALCAPNSGIVFSPNRRSFVSRPLLVFRAENWCDESEFRSLVSIMGPYGAKILDGWLLRSVHLHVTAIKDTLITNAKPLEEIGTCYTKEAPFTEALKRLRDVDAFMQRSVMLGTVLMFRAMLKAAVRSVAEEAVPHIESTLSDALDHYPRNTFLDPALLPTDMISSDYGLEVGTADQPFKAVLKKIHQEGDQKMWRLLPVMFAVCFTGSHWREATYMPSLCAYQNNAHVTSRAITDLIVGFCSLTLPQPQEEKQVALFLQQYIEISSAVLLRMARTMPKSEKLRPLDFPGIMIFLDRFVEECPLISRDILEANVPYSLLRNMFKDVYSVTHRVPEGW